MRGRRTVATERDRHVGGLWILCFKSPAVLRRGHCFPKGPSSRRGTVNRQVATGRTNADAQSSTVGKTTSACGCGLCTQNCVVAAICCRMTWSCRWGDDRCRAIWYGRCGARSWLGISSLGHLAFRGAQVPGRLSVGPGFVAQGNPRSTCCSSKVCLRRPWSSSSMI